MKFEIWQGELSSNIHFQIGKEIIRCSGFPEQLGTEADYIVGWFEEKELKDMNGIELVSILVIHSTEGWDSHIVKLFNNLVLSIEKQADLQHEILCYADKSRKITIPYQDSVPHGCVITYYEDKNRIVIEMD